MDGLPCDRVPESPEDASRSVANPVPEVYGHEGSCYGGWLRHPA